MVLRIISHLSTLRFVHPKIKLKISLEFIVFLNEFSTCLEAVENCNFLPKDDKLFLQFGKGWN